MTVPLCHLSGNWNRIRLDFLSRFSLRYPSSPLMDIYNPAAPVYCDDVETALESMKDLGRIARSGGATTAAILCNTMHLDRTDFEEDTGLKMLDMIAACRERIIKLATKESKQLRVGITGTLQTMNSHLYRFEEKECISVVPSEELQKEIHQIVLDNVKVVLPYHREQFIGVLRRFISEQDGKVDVIVLGCTDLPSLLYKGNDKTSDDDDKDVHLKEIDGVQLIDPIDSLLDLCEAFLPKLTETELEIARIRL